MKILGVPSWRDISVRNQAHWFTCSPQTPSSISFRDICSREMLKAMVSPINITDNIHMLNERSLQRHMNTDYDLMESEIAVVVKDKYAQSQGK